MFPSNESHDDQKIDIRQLVEIAAQCCSKLQSAVDQTKVTQPRGPSVPLNSGLMPRMLKSASSTTIIYSRPLSLVPTRQSSPMPFQAVQVPAAVTALPGPAAPTVWAAPVHDNTTSPNLVPSYSGAHLVHSRPISPLPGKVVARPISPLPGKAIIHSILAPQPFNSTPSYRQVNRYASPQTQRIIPSAAAVVAHHPSPSPSFATVPLQPSSPESHSSRSSDAEEVQHPEKSVPADRTGFDTLHVDSKGWHSQVPSQVEIVFNKQVCAKARAFLYQAPFSPSICFVDGEEYFALKGGWAAIRSYSGVLIWLELFDDSSLADILAKAASTRASAASAKPKPKAKSQTGLKKASPPAGSREKVDINSGVSLRLCGATGVTSVELMVMSIRHCSSDTLLKLPCEDAFVVRPSSDGDSSRSLRATLAAPAGTSSADVAIKVWLSSVQTQI